MNELPPHAAALLEQARRAHGPNQADRERVLSGLHTTLGIGAAAAIAATSTVTASATAAAAAVAEGSGSIAPVAVGGKGALLGWSGALVGWKSTKVMLAAVALGGAVGVGAVSMKPAESARDGAPSEVVASARPTERTIHTARPARPSAAERSANEAPPVADAQPAREETRGAAPQSARSSASMAIAEAEKQVSSAKSRTSARDATSGSRTRRDGEGRRSRRRSRERSETAAEATTVLAAAPLAATPTAQKDDAAAATAPGTTPPSVEAENQADAPSRAPSASVTPPTASKGSSEARPAQKGSSAGELALLRAAMTSLRDHDAERALTLLAEHADRYPSGAFTVERRGLRVVALCEAGLRSQGERERATFLSEAGQSPIAARVRTACGEK